MREVRLTHTLVHLGRSYNQAQRLIALGLIKGRHDKSGKWWVDTDDLTRFIEEERAADGPRAA